ncbi:hypothetical protein ADIS_4090 [Lunatimonas lonarensis]|uniref:Uncharacterized protein n=1 Tax=Lunatimonas lonarensis TaxID=1232681 RepID=R7ZMQ8_9BACT|nr:hypothetical protein ADIS_4090 [Lunatimonas lonarensis]
MGDPPFVRKKTGDQVALAKLPSEKDNRPTCKRTVADKPF